MTVERQDDGLGRSRLPHGQIVSPSDGPAAGAGDVYALTLPREQDELAFA
jgi:hypothetical protein